jgi:hypothetical protein
MSNDKPNDDLLIEAIEKRMHQDAGPTPDKWYQQHDDVITHPPLGEEVEDTPSF